MKAVRIRKPEGFEGIEGLVYEDAPGPSPRSAMPWFRCAQPVSPRPS